MCHHAKARKDQRERAATIDDEDKRRSEGTWTKSSEIRQLQTSTRSLMKLDSSPEQRIDGKGFIPFLGSRHDCAFVSRTQP
jgi:hypothetical protein